MTTAFFKRRVKVTVGDAEEEITIEDLFIKFEVKREATDKPASGETAIYNLNESNETRIREPGKRLRLLAGYGSRLDLLADGEVLRVNRNREGLDRVTRIEYRGNVSKLTGAVFSRPYMGTVSVRMIVRDAIDGIEGLSLGALDAVPEDATEMDFSFDGSVKKLLTQLLRPLGVEWYEDNRIIRFSRRGMSTDDRVVVISEGSGMIGSPTITESGIKVRTLLDPRLGLDSRIRVESTVRRSAASGDAANQRAVEEASGDYKVITLVHQGDNREGDFFTEVEAKRL